MRKQERTGIFYHGGALYATNAGALKATTSKRKTLTHKTGDGIFNSRERNILVG